MRLLSLHLDRYGPFTGHRLAFRPDAHLHVVLGPNEAGKSCALAAVTDLLFGTKDTRYEFLHRGDGLRIGADIVSRDGRALTCFRRRGGRSTLSDAGGKALPDDALAPFLGGISRTVFCNAFGLDALSLRTGAEEMLKSEGEIGSTLFAAASGLRGFRDAVAELDNEAGALFTPTARKRKLNDLIKIYEDARKEVRVERVDGDDWNRLESDLARAAKRLDEISTRRREIAEESSQLKRLRAVAPILAVMDSITTDLARFADLPQVDAVTIAEMNSAIEDATSRTEDLAKAETALVRAEASLAAVIPDESILPWTGAVDALIPASGEYSKNARDLPRVQAEADGVDSQLKAVAIRLGFDDPNNAEAGQPSDAARADLKRLLVSGRETEAEYLRIARELDRLRKELGALQISRSQRVSLVDPGPIRDRHDALRPILADIGRRDEMQSELARASAELDRRIARLYPALAEGLEKSSPLLPKLETIKEHGECIASATQERDGPRRRIDTIDADIAVVKERMRSRQAFSAVPDRDALVRIRKSRDETWKGLRAALFGDPGAPSGADRLERTAAFERATTEADELADRLLQDAQRAADQAADSRRHQELTDERDRMLSQLTQAERRLEDAIAAWRKLWTPLSISVGSPAEMMEWRSRVAEFLKQSDALAERRVTLETMMARIESIRPPLEALAAQLELTDLTGWDIALVNERVMERLRGIAAIWEGARDSEARIAATSENIATGEKALAACSERLETWRKHWTFALSACSLAPDASLDGASAALDAWKEVPALVRERNDKRRRVAGMRRDMDAYETEVRRISAAVEETHDRPTPELMRVLAARVNVAREADAKRAAHRKTRDEAIQIRDKAQDVALRADASLADLRARLALSDTEDLSHLMARLDERESLHDKLTNIHDELARAGEGIPEARLRSGLADLQVDSIEGRLSQLASEAEQLDLDGRVAYSQREQLRAERGRIESGLGSEVATARRSAAAIDIRETARRYVVLKLGSLLLETAIERQRAGQQDPLVARAGALFSDLTGGVYTDLDQAFDDRDQPILTGRRADGRHSVAVKDMSDGTRDQLFLALRLAYLEDYAGRAEPVPFIGDDIFASFDDKRTEYGLAALAAIGSGVQPILFTHHESVVETAQRCLGSRVDIISLAAAGNSAIDSDRRLALV